MSALHFYDIDENGIFMANAIAMAITFFRQIGSAECRVCRKNADFNVLIEFLPDLKADAKPLHRHDR